MLVNGKVISNFKNDNSVLMSKIIICNKEGCNNCGACGKRRNITIDAENTINAQPGEKVIVDLSDKKFNHSILLLFVLPLIAFIVGVLGVYFIRFGLDSKSVDIIALLCGIILSSLVYLITYIKKKKIDSKPSAIIVSFNKEM